jgi:hypothetical protein
MAIPGSDHPGGRCEGNGRDAAIHRHSALSLPTRIAGFRAGLGRRRSYQKDDSNTLLSFTDGRGYTRACQYTGEFAHDAVAPAQGINGVTHQ